jgi:SAM-dependent methyltransferase
LRRERLACVDWQASGVEISEQARREWDLVTYYDSEVHERAGRKLPVEREARRGEYVAQLTAEGRRTVLELGAGPGRDGVAFAEAGFTYTGVDLTPASVAACRAAGLDAQIASVLDLPFPDATFDAGWTMSTLLHVADADLDDALAEILRVLRAGALLAVGLWGGQEIDEGPQGDATHGPARFFSFRTDERVRELLSRHGGIENWATWPGQRGLHYQYAILRCR